MELTIDQALKYGILAHKAGQLQEADRYYTAILRANPRHPDANHNMGVLAVGLGKIEQALPFFEMALDVKPTENQFLISYLDALIRLNKIDDAKEILEQAMIKGAQSEELKKIKKRLGVPERIQPNVQEIPKELLDPLIKLYNEKKFSQLFLETQNLAKQFYNSQTLWNLMGVSAIQSGQSNEAIEAFQKVITLNPNDVNAFNNIGNTLKLSGKTEEALEAYKKAIAIKPNFAQAHYNIGIVLEAQERQEEAIDAFRKAISIKPDFAQAHYNLGNVLKTQKRLAEAIEAFETAISLEPDHFKSLTNLGIILQGQGKLQEAIDIHKKAISIKPDFAEAHNNMGNAFKEKGNLNDAIASYRNALIHRADHNAAAFNMALSLYETGKYEEAASFFQKNDSNISKTWLLKCLYELGDKNEFVNKADELIKIGVKNSMLGSYISRAKAKYGASILNPFCNEPLKYVVHTDLQSRCKFQDVFVNGAMNILNAGVVESKKQGLINNGSQTSGNVFDQIGKHRDQIQSIILDELEKYRSRFQDSSEGLFVNWPLNYRLDGWIVKMKNGGSINPHMHEQGWISGSVYINVPQKVNEDSGNLVVCIESGTGKDSLSKSINVVTGSLCLFPSSLLHYTVPFEADEHRIVLAFDIVPE